MPEISNYTVYTDRMRKSMWDKTFFMDKTPGTQLVVDYGCADGSLIRFLRDLFPSVKLIGFDIDPEMIARAKQDCKAGMAFFSDLDGIVEQIRQWEIPAECITVNFSSVLHEVFHYQYDRNRITGMLSRIRPQYITVRDMMYTEETKEPLSEEIVTAVRKRLPAWQVTDFERVWGPVTIRKNLIHLLLKFRYVENWDREYRENYFSYNEADLNRLLNPQEDYRTILHTRYFLPWCRLDAENFLQTELDAGFSTHFAMILCRKKNSPSRYTRP